MNVAAGCCGHGLINSTLGMTLFFRLKYYTSEIDFWHTHCGPNKEK